MHGRRSCWLVKELHPQTVSVGKAATASVTQPTSVHLVPQELQVSLDLMATMDLTEILDKMESQEKTSQQLCHHNHHADPAPEELLVLLDQKVPVVHLVAMVNLDLQVMTETPETMEAKAHLDLPAILVHKANLDPVESLVRMVFVESRVHPDQKDLPETEDLQDPLAHLVPMEMEVLWDHLVHKAHLDLLETMELQVHKVHPVHLVNPAKTPNTVLAPADRTRRRPRRSRSNRQRTGQQTLLHHNIRITDNHIKCTTWKNTFTSLLFSVALVHVKLLSKNY
jgi:hypothetical protein